ncbi:MAG: penicillin amidase [Ignavibacteriae bacterium]|nr:MAG: penicillin amidase [Ignavibacteriota bacterium]
MNNLVRNSIGIFCIILIITVVLILGSYYMLNDVLPEYSGTIEVKNIKNNIKIYRDKNAVPFIEAANEMDAYFALGYLHAQERLFQMDLTRRAGEGKLSEIFGNKTLFFDKMFKTFGLRKLVNQNYKKYDDTTKKMLKAYANGVNEFIENNEDKFTIEFDILNYNPAKWEPQHSLLIGKLMAWELNVSWWSDIALSRLIQKFGKERVKDILPTFDENSPTIIPDNLNQYSQLPLDLIKLDREFRKFIGSEGTHIGSNNWVVNSKKSSSGQPIIANDPHLAFSAPSKWYVANIETPKLKVSGFTLPGVPGVIIGKNENISWVVTNVMVDDADFYIEEFDSSGKKYLLDEEWRDLIFETDTIKVKDSTDVIFEIVKTHRGPIISDVHTYKKLIHDTTNYPKISMRWSALAFSNELLSMYKMNHAKNWNEFNDALSLFHSPGQNFVYADREGNIGYIAGVKIPKRKSNSPSFIFDGTTSESDWTGFVPFSKNPKLFNPKDNFIASANNKTVNDYPYHISNVWEPKSRITRIIELLESKEKQSVEDFKKYQNDFYSYFAKNISSYVIKAFKDYDINNKNLSISLELLEKWDYNLTAESQVPSIYAVFFNKLMKNIFEDEMGGVLFKEYIFLANIPMRVIPKVLSENDSTWFDNVNTENLETRDEIIRKSFIDAVEYLEKNISDNPAEWQWGKIHKVTFKHFFHGASKILDNYLDVGPFEVGGDGTTIFNTEYFFTKPYKVKLGPSMRYIYDFSNPDKFYMILPTGQSGYFFSDYYDDMTQKWLKGKYVKVFTNLDSIKKTDYFLLDLIREE